MLKARQMGEKEPATINTIKKKTDTDPLRLIQ